MFRCTRNFTNFSHTLFVKSQPNNLHKLTQQRYNATLQNIAHRASNYVRTFWENENNRKLSAVVLLCLLAGKSYYDTYEEITHKQFFDHYLKNKQVDCLYSSDKWIQVHMRNEALFDTKYWFYTEPVEFHKQLEDSAGDEEGHRHVLPVYEKVFTLKYAYNVLYWTPLMLLAWRYIRDMRPKENKIVTNITTKFSSVAGCEEAKLEVMEFVNFLKNPKKYTDLGAKLPTGAILHGPPGTGKTLLAKAIAGEAGVPFLSMAGSEFVEIYVGVGAKRVRDLFADARQQAPCVLFIDEIDTVGSKRTESLNSETSATLNQLLSEMDGMQSRDNVIVFAATNMMKSIDSALLRPGRFDRQIYVSLPDIKGRFAIFEIYLENIKTDPSIDKTELARYLASRTTSFSGADIANLCNEAAIIATRHNNESVTMAHFSAALDRVVAGIENKTRVMSKHERNIVAHHEAGHAVAGWFLENADPLMKVSLVPRGDALGFALYLPVERRFMDNAIFSDQMCVMLAGRVAENIFFGKLSSGASDDLQKVTNSAYNQVMSLGYSDKIGHLSFNRQDNIQPYSESTGKCIDTEVKRIVDEAYARTEKLLMEKKDLLEKLALLLLEKECLEREDIESVFGKRPFKERLSYRDFVGNAEMSDESSSTRVSFKDWQRNIFSQQYFRSMLI